MTITMRRAAGPLVMALVCSSLLVSPGRVAAAQTISSTPDRPVVTSAPLAIARDAPRALVRFSTSSTSEARAAALARAGAVIDEELPALRTVRVTLPLTAGDESGLAVLRLARDPAVASAQLDSTVAIDFTPNDALYLTDPTFGLGQWGLRAARVDLSWEVARGSAAVTVAVIDTGIDAAHPDLAGVALPGAAFVSAPDPSCDPASTGSPVDDNGHGTHVAGIIAAQAGNGIGVAGAAFGVRVLPVKALDCTGSGLLSDVARGIVWATDHGARVINISLGSSEDVFVLHDAVRYAVAHDVLVVAAAGNCGMPSVRCPVLNAPQYPGAYPETLAVAATDPDDEHPSFSNVSPYVGISAPGVTIWSTIPTYPTTLSRTLPANPGYAAFSGSSQAAPLVAAVAALVISHEPALTAAAVADRLKRSADDLGPLGPDPVFGAGRVNALRAVTADLRPTYGANYDMRPLPLSTSTGAVIDTTVTLTNTSTVAWRAGGAHPVRLAYHWSDVAGRTVVWDGARTTLPADLAPGATVTLRALIAPPSVFGAYVLQVDLVREGLFWFSAANVVPLSRTVYVAGAYAARYAPAPDSVAAFRAGAPTISVGLTNTGTATWYASGPNPVRLAYHLLRSDGSMSVWDGDRAAIPADVAPGGSVTVPIAVAAPPGGGAYLIWFDLVVEGVTWFSTQNLTGDDAVVGISASSPVP